MSGAAAFDPWRLSTRAESPPSCSESNLRSPCPADICRWRPLICSATRCCSARSSWIVCWRLATVSLAVLSAISAAAASSAFGRTTATGEDSYPIRLLAQSTAPTATARRRSRIHRSMRRGRPGSPLTRLLGVKSLIQLVNRQRSIRSQHYEPMILRLTLASGWMFPKKSQSVLQAGNAIRRTDRVAGRRSSPLSMRLAPADAEPESGRSCRAVASRRCDPQVIDNLQSGFCDAVMVMQCNRKSPLGNARVKPRAVTLFPRFLAKGHDQLRRINVVWLSSAVDPPATSQDKLSTS